MQVVIDIPDLEEVYCSYYEDESITGKDFKKMLVDMAIEKLVEKMYYGYLNAKAYDGIKTEIKELVKNNSNYIVDSVIKNVSEEILKKKTMAEEMPKKSEIKNISKEWESYFIELIDKAIAKRFK